MRDSTGTYNLPPGNPVITGTIIESVWANTTLADVAAGLTDSLSRSGKGGMSAPLAMGGFRITALGAAMQATDAAQATQVRDTSFTRLTSVSSDATGNNYNATALINTPPVDGTVYLFVADRDNTGPMTLVVNGGAQIAIQINGAPIPPGIILAGAVIGVMFLGLTWRVTNTAGVVGTINTVQSDNVDAISVTNDTINNVAVLHPHTNVPLGLVQLDSNAKVPVSQLPFTALHYIGQWNATPGTNPPAAANGDFYIISGAGNLTIFRISAGNNYTAQVTAVVVGDTIVYNTAGTAAQPVGWYYAPAPGTAVTAANVSLIPTSGTPPFGGITNVQSWLNTADPQIRGKLNLAGGAMTGEIVQPLAPSTDQMLANRGYVLGQIALLPANVSSFNTRTGAVVLTAADVTAALTFTPANIAGQAFTGPVSATSLTASGTATAKAFVQTAFIAAAAAVLDFANGQSQILTLSAPLTITAINNVPAGSILRLILIATNNTVTWPASVAWPLGAAPNLALGPLKKAVVVLENDGTTLLASSSAY